MKIDWRIYIILLLVTSFSTIALCQIDQNFPPIKIARAENILENAEARIMQLASDINLYLGKDISKEKIYEYHFEPLEENQSVFIEPEDKSFGPRDVENYLNLLKSKYEEVNIKRYATLAEEENSCERIFHYKANPDIGIFSMRVIRMVDVKRYMRKNETNIGGPIIDTSFFTFKINLTEITNENPKIVNISKLQNFKTIEIMKSVVCVEDEEERIWNQIQKRRTPQRYSDYLDQFPDGRYRLEAANERYFLNQRIIDLEVMKSDKNLFTPENLEDFLEEYRAEFENSIVEEDIIKFINDLNEDSKDYIRIKQSNPHTKEKARKKWELNQLQKHVESFTEVCQHLEELNTIDSTIVDPIFNTLSNDEEDYLRIKESNPHKEVKDRNKWELKQLLKHFKAFGEVCQHFEELNTKPNTISDDAKDYWRIKKSKLHKKEKARKKWELRQLKKHVKSFGEVCQHFEELNTKLKNNDSKTHDSKRSKESIWAIEFKGGASYEGFYTNPFSKKDLSFSSIMNTASPSGELGVSHISTKGFIFQLSGGIKRAIYNCDNIMWQTDQFRDTCISFGNDSYLKEWIWNTNLSLGFDFVPRKNFIFGVSASLKLQGGEFPEINSVNSLDPSSSSITPIVTKNTYWGGGSFNLHLGTVPQKNGWGFEFIPQYNYWIDFNSNRKHHYPQIDLGLILVFGN